MSAQTTAQDRKGIDVAGDAPAVRDRQSTIQRERGLTGTASPRDAQAAAPQTMNRAMQRASSVRVEPQFLRRLAPAAPSLAPALPSAIPSPAPPAEPIARASRLRAPNAEVMPAKPAVYQTAAPAYRTAPAQNPGEKKIEVHIDRVEIAQPAVAPPRPPRRPSPSMTLDRYAERGR